LGQPERDRRARRGPRRRARPRGGPRFARRLRAASHNAAEPRRRPLSGQRVLEADIAFIPRSLESGDWNRDGIGDIAVARDTKAVFFFGDGAGGLPTRTSVALPAGFQSEEILSFDADGDGWNEAAIADLDRVVLVRGDGAGGFSAAPVLESGGFDVAAADFDSDGAADLAIVSESLGDQALHVALGLGTGSFSLAATLPYLGPSVATGDFDENGFVDLVLSRVFLNEVRILLGDGAVGFSEGQVLLPGELRPNGVFFDQPVVVADLDGDGHADLAWNRRRASGPATACVAFGDGSGGFPATAEVAVELTSGSFSAADVDGDGVVDLGVAGRTESLQILRNRGDRTFASRASFQAAQEGSHPEALDLDSDGQTDFALLNRPFSSADPEVTTALNRSAVAPEIRARRGNVNAGTGNTESVLLVNGTGGRGPLRHLVVDRKALFEIRMKAPPALGAEGPARFVLYAWLGVPARDTVRTLPAGAGTAAMPMLAAGTWTKCWNNIGARPLLGVPDFPSGPAPSLVFRAERGVRRRGMFFLQGLIEDPGSPAGNYAVTNGIEVESR